MVELVPASNGNVGKCLKSEASVALCEVGLTTSILMVRCFIFYFDYPNFGPTISSCNLHSGLSDFSTYHKYCI